MAFKSKDATGNPMTSVVSDDLIKKLGQKGRGMQRYLEASKLYKPLNNYPVSLENGRVTYGEGYPITAMEKFLGYYDKAVNAAYAPSISIVTDFSIAKAFCRYIDVLGKDAVYLDGETNEKYMKRAKKALDYWRSINNISGSFQFIITRDKRYEKAKGLGESAAVAAAVARAFVANVFGVDASKDDSFVSRYAKLVSGSGSRSATGGLSVWLSYPGIKEEDSYGVRLPVDTTGLHFVVYPDFHTIETLNAHGIASSSPFYPAWITGKYDKVMKILEEKSLSAMMAQAQQDMFNLNALLLSGDGTVIQTDNSFRIIRHVLDFQKEGGRVFMTADTGPSIVVMSDDESELERFIKEETATALRGKIPDTPKCVASEVSINDAESFFNSLRG